MILVSVYCLIPYKENPLHRYTRWHVFPLMITPHLAPIMHKITS